jgi:hypothetical protein
MLKKAGSGERLQTLTKEVSMESWPAQMSKFEMAPDRHVMVGDMILSPPIAVSFGNC